MGFRFLVKGPRRDRPAKAGTVCWLLLALVLGLSPAAGAFDLLGTWSYRQSGGDNQETQSLFQQTYQLGVGPTATLRPTNAMTLSGGVGYRNTQRNSGDGFQSVEQLSPFAQFSLYNDIFAASLSANTFITLAGAETSSSFWNASLGSTWDEPLWPGITFNYGEDFSGVNRAALFDDSSGKNRNTTVTVDWDLLLAKLYYQYSISEVLDNQGDSQSDARTHFANIETGGRFWSDRLTYNLTQNYRQVDAEFNVNEADLEGGAFGDFVPALEARSAVVNDPVTGPAPEDVEPTVNPLLNDGIFTVPAVTVGFDERAHFSLVFSLNEQIDALFLSLDPLTPLTPVQAVTLQWSLYVRNPTDPTVWELVGPVPFTFNDDEKRFELGVDVSAGEVMVVMTNTVVGVTLDFTEIRALRLITEDTTSQTVSYQTTFGTRYRITRTMGVSFNTNYEHIETETSGQTVGQTDKLSWGSRLSWSPSPYFSPSIGYSEYREERAGDDDFLNGSYSLTVSSRPLAAVNLSLGYTHNDRFINDEKTFLSDVYSIFGKARIYPDLTTSMSLSYSDSDTLQEELGTGRSFFVNRKSWSSRVDVTAKLYRSLTAYLSTNYSITEDELTGWRESGNVGVRLNYRPSDLLSLQSSYVTFLGDDDRSDAFSNGLEIYLLRTYKTRLSLFANHLVSDRTIDTLRLLGSWDISDYFTLTGSGIYTLSQVNSYSFNINLSMRL